MSVNSDHTSMSLLARAVAEDDQAWHQLVQLYGPLVHRWCRQAGLSDDDTSDVFQDTFGAVSRKLDSFEPRRAVAPFRSWLKTIVRSKIIDLARKQKRQAAAAGGTEAQLRISEIADPFSVETEDEIADDNSLVVQRAMQLIRDEFDPRNWAAFQSVAIEGKSASDVARELGVEPQAIRQANYRIRRRLRLVLENLVEPPVMDDRSN